jgi:hypothetical protein
LSICKNEIIGAEKAPPRGLIDVPARVFIRSSNYDNRLFLSSNFEVKIKDIQAANKQAVPILICSIFNAAFDGCCRDVLPLV